MLQEGEHELKLKISGRHLPPQLHEAVESNCQFLIKFYAHSISVNELPGVGENPWQHLGDDDIPRQSAVRRLSYSESNCKSIINIVSTQTRS